MTVTLTDSTGSATLDTCQTGGDGLCDLAWPVPPEEFIPTDRTVTVKIETSASADPRVHAVTLHGYKGDAKPVVP